MSGTAMIPIVWRRTLRHTGKLVEAEPKCSGSRGCGQGFLGMWGKQTMGSRSHEPEQGGAGWVWGTQTTGYFVTELDLGPVSFDFQLGAFLLAPLSSYSSRSRCIRYTEAEVHPAARTQGIRGVEGQKLVEGGVCAHNPQVLLCYTQSSLCLSMRLSLRERKDVLCHYYLFNGCAPH